jgi:hypothetical protein
MKHVMTGLALAGLCFSACQQNVESNGRSFQVDKTRLSEAKEFSPEGTESGQIQLRPLIPRIARDDWLDHQ